jgi:hypothetical protein
LTPRGDGLLVAWLLSAHNLDEAGLAQASARIRAGQPIRPGERQLDRARRALGASLASDPGLALGARLGLLAVSVLATPLVGLTLAWSWREERPRAALQALALSLPFSALFLGLGVWRMFA